MIGESSSQAFRIGMLDCFHLVCKKSSCFLQTPALHAAEDAIRGGPEEKKENSSLMQGRIGWRGLAFGDVYASLYTCNERHEQSNL
jgi:hypothetical protein